MDPLLILAAGMVVVVGAILGLRLHAFLALMLGALTVALLTSRSQLFEAQLTGQAATVVDATEGQILIQTPDEIDSPSSGVYWVRREEATADGQANWRSIGNVLLEVTDERRFRVVSFLDLESSEALSGPTERVTPSRALRVGDQLFPAAVHDAAQALRNASQTKRIAAGFANTCGKIGIIIALAAVIGQCLLDSGAAERIVDGMRKLFGERRTPAALSLSGFVIGIPVYFDTVFYLLLPLARALGRRNPANYLLYVLSIIVGGTMAHSLVPPTPGPLLVASELNVSLGTMILAGGGVGLAAVASGFLYALWANRHWTIAVPEGESHALAEPANRLSRAPSLGWSLLPIFLPVVLLAIGTFLDANSDATASPATPLAILRFISDKHIALAIATFVSLVMLIRHADGRDDWVKSVSTSIASAGSIVLITSAGGAFGHVLRQSGIANAIQSRFPATESGLMILMIAFAVTAIVRVAQGSATVAMITSVGIVAPLVSATVLPYHPVYVALAIGCGSKPLPWMNDSGFWVITRMSGMTEAESLKTFSVVLTIMGVVGLLVTLAGATWLPLK